MRNGQNQVEVSQRSAAPKSEQGEPPMGQTQLEIVVRGKGKIHNNPGLPGEGMEQRVKLWGSHTDLPGGGMDDAHFCEGRVEVRNPWNPNRRQIAAGPGNQRKDGLFQPVEPHHHNLFCFSKLKL